MGTANRSWLKSSYSGGDGGQCLEWAPSEARKGTVPVRDSKDTERAPLAFSTHAWSAFVAATKHSAR
ncbi:DUF397 domain-containing protein [Streptomyces albus subsp. chlorinus]|uniref:DUF397 domain-containing protein n=1 Tax=Streptomyces albus TaxID=1888 RepID=UPI00156E30FD|nr:DUF397 domain-containing protein [Streptomyces albus]NSC24899.1 DUF397 domain-containing protein [Streptomyces albus subsp. chlorinus]